MKSINVINCPACYLEDDKYLCNKYAGCCCQIKDCVVKQVISKPHNRKTYIQNKLDGCLGYSKEQKKIRYEELDWIGGEFVNILNIKIQENKDV